MGSKFGGTSIDPMQEDQGVSKFGGVPVDPYVDEVESPPPVETQPEQPEQNLDAWMLNGLNESLAPFSGMTGEIAAGTNEAVVGFVDLLAKAGNLSAGGYKGLMTLLGTGDINSAVNQINQTRAEPPIPLASDAINNMLAEAALDMQVGESVMAPSTVQQAAKAFGNVMVPGAVGMKAVQGRNLSTSAGQAAELLGFGSASPAQTVSDIVSTADDLAKLSGDDAVRVADDFLPATVADDIPNKPSANKKLARELSVKRGGGDVTSAGYKLDDLGNTVRDPSQQKALKAGIDKGAVAMIKAASKATKQRMKDMLDIVEGGKENLEYRSLNRPGKVVGQSLEDRLSVVRQANKDAGQAIDVAAEGLKTKYVDVRPAMDNFLGELDNQGIILDPQTGKLDFSESSIEGLTQAQNIVKRMVNRLWNTNKGRVPTAHDVHRAKRFIDNQVTYGKTQAGLSGEMSGILKRLRHDLDGILDANFDDYNQANTVYSETIQVLDDIQSLAGQRADLMGDNADRALGIMSRKILSNYASGTNMLDTFNSLDDVAGRYGAKAFDDEIVKMVAYESELRRLFPEVAPANSFQGEIGAEVARGAVDAVTGNKPGLIARGLKAAGKAFGKTEESQLEALRELLE